MKTYIKRLKNMWIDSNIFGKICLLVFSPLWLLAGFNDSWDSIHDIKIEFDGRKETLKKEVHHSVSNVLPDGVSKVNVNDKWECCKCGWIGKHSESADKTIVINDMYLLVCPNCWNKDEFYACKD